MRAGSLRDKSLKPGEEEEEEGGTFDPHQTAVCWESQCLERTASGHKEEGYYSYADPT